MPVERIAALSAKRLRQRARNALCGVLMATCTLTTGCASISWRTPDGGSATVRRFIWKSGFSRLYIKTDTTTVYVYGYSGKTDEIATKAILEGIVSGLK